MTDAGEIMLYRKKASRAFRALTLQQMLLLQPEVDQLSLGDATLSALTRGIGNTVVVHNG
jgi:hypothetical protein